MTKPAKSAEFLEGNESTPKSAPKSLPESIKATLGRSSEYQPEYCDTAITYLAKGHGLTALAYHIRVAPQTIRNWIKAYPEFAEAVEIGRAGRVERIEDNLNKTGKALTGPMVQAGWKVLTNIAPDEYRDKVTIESESGLTSQKALEEMREEFRALTHGAAKQLVDNRALTAASVIDAEFEEVVSMQPDNPHTDDIEQATKKPPTD